MTAKEFVRSKYPKARAESHKENSGKVYWLIRNGSSYFYMSQGATQSKAWVAAKEKIKETEKEKQTEK